MRDLLHFLEVNAVLTPKRCSAMYLSDSWVNVARRPGDVKSAPRQVAAYSLSKGHAFTVLVATASITDCHVRQIVQHSIAKIVIQSVLIST